MPLGLLTKKNPAQGGIYIVSLASTYERTSLILAFLPVRPLK